jgi:hypothetical protein
MTDKKTEPVMGTIPKDQQLFKCEKCKDFRRLTSYCKPCDSCLWCGTCDTCFSKSAKVGANGKLEDKVDA